MERIERVVVPVAEAVRYLLLADDAHLRLALLLLDSTAELLMHRECTFALAADERSGRIIGQLDAMREAMRRAGHDEAPDDEYTILQRSRMISKTRARKIDREFDSKAEFLVERGLMDPTFTRVLAKLHAYRNAAYHRDELRPRTLLSAVQIYVYMVCQMMKALPVHSISHLVMADMPQGLLPCMTPRPRPPHTDTPGHDFVEALGYVSEGLGASFALQGEIGDALLTTAKLANHDLGPALSAHVIDRLDELEETLEWCAGSMAPWDVEWTPKGIWHLVQIPPAVSGLQLRIAADVLAYPSPKLIPYSALTDWRDQASTLKAIQDRIEAFTVFADIEDAMEPVETLLNDLYFQLDERIQLEIDLARGK